METKDILKVLTELDGQKEAATNADLLDSLKDIEQSMGNLRALLIYSRVKKILATVEQKDTDIYVQTMPKAGTTLAQMLLYQMTTDGSMDFNHIYDVSPWYMFAARGGSAKFEEFLQNPPLFESRKIIKSHQAYSMFQNVEKGKIVYIIRDGKDQILSDFHQHKNYFGYKKDFEQFVDSYMEQWFTINEEWLKNENQYPIIYVHYEDLVLRKKMVIERLAGFLEIPITKEIVDRTIARSSFDFMKQHETKFGEKPETKNKRVFDQFIRKGKVGKGKSHFTEEQKNRYSELSKSYLATHELSKRYFLESIT